MYSRIDTNITIKLLKYLICNKAQNTPEFLDIVEESEFNVKYAPCPVQITEAPKPITTDMK